MKTHTHKPPNSVALIQQTPAKIVKLTNVPAYTNHDIRVKVLKRRIIKALSTKGILSSEYKDVNSFVLANPLVN